MSRKHSFMQHTIMAFNFQFILLLLSLFQNVVDCEYASSLVGVQELAKREQGIIQSLVKYRTILLKRLQNVDRYLEEYKATLEPLANDTDNEYSSLKRAIRKSRSRDEIVPIFISDDELDELSKYASGHPILTYRLIRRLAKELPEIKESLSTTIEDDLTRKIKETELPDEEDINGAATGLLRIQTTYIIPTESFAAGKFGSHTYNLRIPLDSAFDLHLLGLKAINNRHLSIAIQWFHKAYTRVLQGDDSLLLQTAKESLQTAVKKHNEGLGITNDFTNHYYFPQPLNSNLSLLIVPSNFLPCAIQTINDGELIDEEEDWMSLWNFQPLCQGRILQSPKIRKELNCYYKSDSPLTFISPVAVEVHSKNPLLLLQFYNVASNKTISHIKEKARPKLSRGKVVGTSVKNTGARTSTVTWLKKSGDAKLEQLSGLIRDLTGLETESAEELQVSSYGAIGGHYDLHFDNLYDAWQSTAALDQILRGDRIATFMLYLSDVEMGGGTAFPRVGVATTPSKGSAVFWYNMKRNGGKDLLSLHGGCPVGQGIKWVANKWIRANEQFKTRRCSLQKEL